MVDILHITETMCHFEGFSLKLSSHGKQEDNSQIGQICPQS